MGENQLCHEEEGLDAPKDNLMFCPFSWTYFDEKCRYVAPRIHDSLVMATPRSRLLKQERSATALKATIFNKHMYFSIN